MIIGASDAASASVLPIGRIQARNTLRTSLAAYSASTALAAAAQTKFDAALAA